jgi:hypothetical protein
VRRSCEQGLTVTQAIEGFILHKNPAFGGAGEQGLSQRTVSSYKDILEHWAARIGGETQVPSITSQDLKRYLVWKTTEYVPIRKNGKTHPFHPKRHGTSTSPSKLSFAGLVRNSSPAILIAKIDRGVNFPAR